MKKLLLCKSVLVLVDFLTLSLSIILSSQLLEAWTGSLNSYMPTETFYDHFRIHLTLSFIGVSWFWIRLRHYTYRKPFWFELKEVLRTLVILAVIELAIVAFSKLYFSRYLWGLTWGIVLIIVPIGRVVAKKLLIKSKLYLLDTVIIGNGQNAIDAYHALVSESYLGFKIKYFIASNYSESLKRLNIPILDEQDKNLWESSIKKSDQFVIAVEEDDADLRDHWLRYFSTRKYRSVSVIPTLRGLPLYSTNMSFVFSYEVMLLRINNNLAKRSARFLKRTMDILGSLMIIVLLSPLLLYLYFAVKKDGGNVIYGHPRIGRNGKEFKCLKFRSMVVNSKEVLEHLLATDPEAKAEWDKDFKLRNDPRITKIGAFIRRTSLDELPQLFNVLKGEMSLVGPRPIIKDELERYEEDVDYYLMAKPGMTGLWQVSGRNDVDYETRVYFDAWYVKNWSLWNDIAILFKTVNVVLKRDGAY